MSTTIQEHDSSEVLDLDALLKFDFEKYGDKGHFQQDHFYPTKLAYNARPHFSHYDHKTVTIHDFYSVGGWTAEGEGRLVQGGPKVEGPHAYMFEQGVMIPAHKQPDEQAVLVHAGDIVKLYGTHYQIVQPVRPGSRGKYPELHVVADENVSYLLNKEERVSA